MEIRPLLLGVALLATAPAPSAQVVLQPQAVAPRVALAPAPTIEAREQRWLAEVSPPVREWVAAEAQRQRVVPQPDAGAIAANAQAAFPAATPADLEALAFLVMAAVARDADEDLRAQAEALQAANERKRAQREAARQAREAQATLRKDSAAGSVAPAPASPAAPRTVTRAELAQAPRPDDAMADRSEEVALRLQAQQERRARILETLSNMMKKISETQSSITGNIK
jgi:hypothetical protein